MGNAETLYTNPASKFSTGCKEESTCTNAELGKSRESHIVHDNRPKDHRSSSRPDGNYINYQCGKQHVVSIAGGHMTHTTPYQTSAQASFSSPLDPAKWVPTSSARCDLH